MKFLFTITHRHIIWFAACLLVFGSFGGVFLFERSYAGRFFPNIIIGGEQVGGKSYDEVLSRVKLVGEALKANGIQLIVPTGGATTTIVIPEVSIGLTPDVVVEYFSLGDYESVVKEAFDFGRRGSILERLQAQASLLYFSQEFVLPFALRQTAVESLLNREFDSLLKKVHDAYFISQSGQILIAPEITGERIDIPAVILVLKEALLGMKTNRLRLSSSPQLPLVTKNKLSGILDFANKVNDSLTLSLNYDGGTAKVPGATLATWMTLKAEPGISIIVKRDEVSDFIRKFIDSRIDDAPQNSRFAMRDGILTETLPGVAGSVASTDEIASKIEQILMQRYLTATFYSGLSGQNLTKENIPLSLQLTHQEPRITSSTIAQFKIHDLVGSSTTSFKGSSASRRHNIETGVARSSGILIAPGEEFSLVKAIGEVTEETGFEKEYVIKNDRSVKEAGGGLCQLATTVFRAALDAGLKITERQNHSYVVGYYGPGLDATIYGPHPDLRFVNDTGGYLLFQMRTSGDNLIAEFYGQQDGRTVAISKPELSHYIDPPPNKYLPAVDKPWGQQECTDQPRKGLTAEATYTVTYADGSAHSQVFKSVYQPWPKICLVGIKI